MSILTIKSENFPADKEVAEAQRQWEQDGTVTDKYLRYTLGDISKGISAFAPEIKEKKESNKKKPHTS